jgi:hypothetical protein
MWLQPYPEMRRGGRFGLSRARKGITRRLIAAAEMERRVGILVVERLSPSMTIESTPLVMLLAVLASLISLRRH